LGDRIIAGKPNLSMRFATTKVLPEPVTPSKTCRLTPASNLAAMASMVSRCPPVTENADFKRYMRRYLDFHSGTKKSGASPSNALATPRTVIIAISRRVSSVALPIWGAITTFFNFNNRSVTLGSNS